MEIFKSCIVALVASFFCIWLLRPLAPKIGLVDRPGGRKVHDDDVPLIGGIAMFFGFCFSLLTLHTSLQPYRGLIAASGLLLLVGVVDDMVELSSRLRLFAQVVACFFLINWDHQYINHMGNLFFVGNIKLNMWGIPFTVMAVMAFINSMNMIDGQDGLAGGTALTQVSMLGYISFIMHQHVDGFFLLIMSVIICVFLSFNFRFPGRKKAIVFMGDSGSTFLAIVIAWFAINLSQLNSSVLKPITILWVVAFPLFDMSSVMIYRLRRRQAVFQASRDHFHHVLHVAGINTSISTLLLCALSILLGIFGILLNYLDVPEGLQLIIFVTALCSYLYMVKIVRDKV